MNSRESKACLGFESSFRHAALLSALIVAPGALGQNLLSNPSFETPSAGSMFVLRGGAGAMGAWDVTGAVDHIGAYWQAAHGGQSVDLNGDFASTVSQSFTTVSGRVYLVRYSVSENMFGTGDKTMDVLWNGAVVLSEVIAHNPARTVTSMQWLERSTTVTATGASSTIGFRSTTGAMPGSLGVTTYYGPALDNVRVTAICGRADVAGPDQSVGPDGWLTADDVIVFLGWFFTSDVRADVAGPNQSTTPDGFFTPDDVIVFLSRFFTGC